MTAIVAITTLLFDRKGFKDINWVQCIALDIMIMSIAFGITSRE